VAYSGTWSGNILRVLNRGLESASTNKASSKSAILSKISDSFHISRTRLNLRKYHSKVSVLNAVCCSCAVWYNAHPPKFKYWRPKYHLEVSKYHSKYQNIIRKYQNHLKVSIPSKYHSEVSVSNQVLVTKISSGLKGLYSI